MIKLIKALIYTIREAIRIEKGLTEFNKTMGIKNENNSNL